MYYFSKNSLNTEKEASKAFFISSFFSFSRGMFKIIRDSIVTIIATDVKTLESYILLSMRCIFIDLVIFLNYDASRSYLDLAIIETRAGM